jgi:hypothetical protein
MQLNLSGFELNDRPAETFDRQNVEGLRNEPTKLPDTAVEIFALMAHKFTAEVRRELVVLSVTAEDRPVIAPSLSHLANLKHLFRSAYGSWRNYLQVNRGRFAPIMAIPRRQPAFFESKRTDQSGVRRTLDPKS